MLFVKKNIISMLAIAAFASTSVLAVPSVNEKQPPIASGSLTAPTITAAAVATGVAVAVITNAQGQALPVDTTTLSCNNGDALINGVCVQTSSTVTVTVTGTGTGTTTMTVPVTTTYAPSQN